jgi:hypothetical protein
VRLLGFSSGQRNELNATKGEEREKTSLRKLGESRESLPIAEVGKSL